MIVNGKALIIANINEHQQDLVMGAMLYTGQSSMEKAIFQVLREYIDEKHKE